MKDEEIVEALQKGDRLMAEYKAALQPVLDELANRKSMHVFGEPGHYRGEFGCFEEGAESLCLHIKDLEEVFPEDPDKRDYQKTQALARKANEFEDEWRQRAAMKELWLTGHH